MKIYWDCDPHNFTQSLDSLTNNAASHRPKRLAIIKAADLNQGVSSALAPSAPNSGNRPEIETVSDGPAMRLRGGHLIALVG
jgi:hypothetical protein